MVPWTTGLTAFTYFVIKGCLAYQPRQKSIFGMLICFVPHIVANTRYTVQDVMVREEYVVAILIQIDVVGPLSTHFHDNLSMLFQI